MESRLLCVNTACGTQKQLQHAGSASNIVSGCNAYLQHSKGSSSTAGWR